jgi:hypothetical protein
VVSLTLPGRPALELLRKQAKHVLKVGRIRAPAWNLADAQLAVSPRTRRRSKRDESRFEPDCRSIIGSISRRSKSPATTRSSGAPIGGSVQSPTGEVASYAGTLMHILKRQADGPWKMHRTMLTMDSRRRGITARRSSTA